MHADELVVLFFTFFFFASLLFVVVPSFRAVSAKPGAFMDEDC
jgi:hypothetical protein